MMTFPPLSAADDRAIVLELGRLADGGASGALATVARVVGSAYRGVGARLLVRGDGSTLGMVSGGCLEGDLAARAAAVIADGRAEVVTYDTRSGDDLVWGLGLGCEGVVEVLLEPLAPDTARALATFLGRARASATPCVVATVFRAPDEAVRSVGARLLLDGEGATVASHGEVPASLAEALREDACAMLRGDAPRARGTAREYVVDERVLHVSLEPIVPPVRLVVCGAGPDAAPVARHATALGWEVTVVDHRPRSALHGERFPGVAVTHCAESRELARVVPLDARTHAVVMSHHFERDLGYLAALVAAEAPYVGLLGPRSRAERLFAEHRARIAPLDEHTLARVHAPVGLDLGGDDAEQVALAIIAEVMAVSNGRRGGPLSKRNAPIHTPADRASSHV